MIEAWLDEFYQRHRRHYLAWWAVFAHVLLQLIVQPFLPAFSIVLGLSLEEHLRFAAWLAVGLPLSGILQYWFVVRLFPDSRAWLSGSESVDLLDVWAEVVDGPRVLAVSSGSFAAPVTLAAPIVATGGDLSLGLMLVWLAMGVVSIVSVTSIWPSGNRLFNRPVIRELSRSLPEPPLGDRRPSVERQLAISVGSTAVSAALIGGASAIVGSGPVARSWWLIGGIILGGAYTIALFKLLSGNPTVRPLRDLTKAAHQVAEGELAVLVPVTSDDELGQLARAFNRMTTGLRERARLQAAFGSYVDPALAERLLDQGGDLFEGESVEVTVFFLDVRGFTAYTEAHEATDVVGTLNRMFERVVPIIRAHGGHANKFLGDGLMAVFGTPEPLENHADRAVTAATEILAAVEDEFGGEIRIGIGVDTGKVVAGTLGGGGKLEFTLIGDPVNTAARVEAQTKQLGRPLLITEATHASLDGQGGDFAALTDVALRGKADHVRLFGMVR